MYSSVYPEELRVEYVGVSERKSPSTRERGSIRVHIVNAVHA